MNKLLSLKTQDSLNKNFIHGGSERGWIVQFQHFAEGKVEVEVYFEKKNGDNEENGA